MARLDELLITLKNGGGSDLHLAAGLRPRIRAKGSLGEIEGWPELDDAELRSILQEIASPRQWQDFCEQNDLDFAYGLQGVARFRANYFVQGNGAGAVFRIIPEKIISLEDLNLPPAVAKLAELQSGLVAVTGPTGSGKSTTMAAIIDRINATQAKHIITIEDPVEFVHQNKMSILTHREVGSHTGSFSEALTAALRQDADVILVGEMRDLETISAAITAAEMGVLVFGTLHTNSAIKTVDRIVDVFPSDQQNQVRLSLSESMAAVVSQLLLPTADGKGRCAVNEILLRTKALPNIIREGNTPMLTNIIQAGRSLGMQMMDDALMAAVNDERITKEDAARKAMDKDRFQ